MTPLFFHYSLFDLMTYFFPHFTGILITTLDTIPIPVVPEDLLIPNIYPIVPKRRTPSHQSTEHELEDQLNEWANMTGFLCSLGSVCLTNQQVQLRSRNYTFL